MSLFSIFGHKPVRIELGMENIAPSSSRNQELVAERRIFFEKNRACSQLARSRSSHHARRPSADDNDIEIHCS